MISPVTSSCTTSISPTLAEPSSARWTLPEKMTFSFPPDRSPTCEARLNTKGMASLGVIVE
jgi:hypothetical protein